MSQILIFRSERVVRVTHSRSLQRMFDQPPVFAFEKTGVASNAPEFRCWAPKEAWL
jgi:hypothetical protein